MKNFVYCIDKNFNTHAYLSIISLLKTVPDKVNVYIIHKNPRSFNSYQKLLNRLFPSCVLKIIKFNFKIKNYPNLKNSHVSEATYYRMFISEHIEEDIEFITYLDADAYVVSDPSENINSLIDQMKNNNKILSALTTNFYEDIETRDIFDRLNITHKYFNAGVMIINLKEWKRQDVVNKLKKIKDDIYNEIVYWDQDVLNKYFDGDYIGLSKNLNYLVNIETDKRITSDIKIFHFLGKSKPWNTNILDSEYKSFYDTLKNDYT